MSGVDMGVGIIFLIPFLIALSGPIAMFLAIVIWPVKMIFKTITKLFRKKPIPYIPIEEGPEFMRATRTGYFPDVPLNEVSPHPLNREHIDRIIKAREVIFPVKFQTAFYDPNNSPDLNPDELKRLALRLFLEMAFVRPILLENSPDSWSEQTERFWFYNVPRPLRKLDPDFYQQLLTKLKQSTTGSRQQAAA